MADLKLKVRPGRQTVDNAAVQRVANGPAVRRDLNRRAVRVAAFTRISIPMRTGKLRSSVRIEDASTPTRASVQVLVGRGVPYAGAVLFGAAPHVITPRRKKALRFVGGGGKVIFAKSVRHPGNKASPVLKEAPRFWKD
jgi:hypothetical protein